MDSAYFLETLAGNFMDVVQYNEDNRAFEVSRRDADELFVPILIMFQHG